MKERDTIRQTTRTPSSFRSMVACKKGRFLTFEEIRSRCRQEDGGPEGLMKEAVESKDLQGALGALERLAGHRAELAYIAAAADLPQVRKRAGELLNR